MNTFTPGSKNYYYYEYMKAQDILRDTLKPDYKTIHNVQAYKQLWKNTK